MGHVGEEVSVGGGVLLEELTEEELRGVRRRRVRRDGHCGFGGEIEEMGRDWNTMKWEETESKHSFVCVGWNLEVVVVAVAVGKRQR